MTLLHPFLLWGLAAIAVPILIHLLLRQRPKLVPWAAMRWLAAAHREASRRWKLTNLLLLLLRCLAVAALAMAIVRPALPGLGGGDHLVVVIDRTASMGPRDDDAGALAQAQAALATAELPYTRWTLLAVGGGTERLASGTRAAALEALGRLSARPLPGGLDAADAAMLGEMVPTGADVLLVSDFQQDDGAALSARLAPTARRVTRWVVGRGGPNRFIAAAPEAGDPLPGEGGELRLGLGGPAGPVRLGIDGAPPVQVAERASGELRVPLPPLPAGEHRVRVVLDRGGLAYDDTLEVPLRVRPPLAALVVADHGDYAGAALLADDLGLKAERVRPGAFAGAALPPGGVALLRSPVADAQRLAAWVRAGGVLWADLDLLLADPALAALLPGVARVEGVVPGGAYATGEPELDEVLAAASRIAVRAARLPEGARILLRAGAAPACAALPSGRGWVVTELDDLAGDAALAGRGTAPLWVVRTARRLAAVAEAPVALVAGSSVPEAMRLGREGMQVDLAAGAPLLVAPGTWTAAGRSIIVLPSPEEARSVVPPAGLATTLSEALPVRAGLDLGWWLLLLALAFAAAEMLLAAYAGRRYGG
jgi:hypothetical protein